MTQDASDAVNINEFCQILRTSRATLGRMKKAKELPPPIPTKRRMVRWLRADILLWIELGCPNESDFRKLKRTRQQFGGSNVR